MDHIEEAARKAVAQHGETFIVVRCGYPDCPRSMSYGSVEEAAHYGFTDASSFGAPFYVMDDGTIHCFIHKDQ